MKKNTILIAIVIVGLTCNIICINQVGAQDTLAEQYAPIFYFEKQETCFPVTVEYHVSNSYLYQIGQSNPIDQSPTMSTLSNYSTDGFYLDNQRGDITDMGIINDYQSQQLGFTVYTHIIESGSTTIIQYWMFYAFNRGTQNQHEGDWEMVQVVLSNDKPSQVMYSQHHTGQKAFWDQVEKQGSHIKVYVSRGSHANYFRSYSGVIGLANDHVGANGDILYPSDYDLEVLETQPWLDFAGLWGWAGTTEEEYTTASLLGQTGPHGPKYRENGQMWNGAEWADHLIPLNTNVLLLEFVLYHFISIFLIISLIIISLAFYRIYKRHKTTSLGPRILSIFYIDAGNLKSLGNILCIVALIVAIIALFQPWYLVTTDIGVSGYETNGMEEMLRIDGINGLQMQIPGVTGPMPVGSVVIPFSLLIGISLVFLIINSIGISSSKKLGKIYLYKGIRLVIPIIILIVLVMMLGMIPFESIADTGETTLNINQIISNISNSPLGGQQSISLSEISGSINLQWGLGLGAILLLCSGILFAVAGFLEHKADTILFEKNHTKRTVVK